MTPRASRTSAARGRTNRTRAPEATRDRLVAAAFEAIHRHGYQGAGLDTILASAGVTKGALYHHFADKAELAHAVIDEVIRGLTLQRWTGPLASYDGDPISGIELVLDVAAAEFCDERFGDKVELGCPLNNITQEMSPLDERFRRRVAVVFETWIESFAQALERGRAEGTVRRDVDARKVATFIVSSIEGSFGLAKNAKSALLLRENFEVLKEFNRLFVDDMDYALFRGDYAAWVNNGDIAEKELRDKIDGNIGEVVLGSKQGRVSDNDRILAVIQGMAVCDLAMAAYCIEKGARTGIGTVVESIANSPGRHPPKGNPPALHIAQELKKSKARGKPPGA